ncbi:MAG TPA: hypothetical protein VFU63_13490 [Ktedonobacterales bacterium]|nr:hypothetical protein [Ktedonobacterales bacterium]
MSWHALSRGFLESGNQTNIWTPIRVSPQPPAPTPTGSGRSLGTATADARWRWASPRAGCVGTVGTAGTVGTDVVRRDETHDDEAAAIGLRVARNLRAEMAEMARTLGCSEDEIWAEAAREWLMRRTRNDEPPPTTPAAAPIPSMRTRRLWNEIDVMLADLRHPRYVAAPPEPTMPAA